MKRHWIIVCIMLTIILGAFPANANYPHFDAIITGGKVIDGTGNPWYYADVGIINDRIAVMGNLEGAAAGRCIDATGMVVAPGSSISILTPTMIFLTYRWPKLHSARGHDRRRWQLRRPLFPIKESWPS